MNININLAEFGGVILALLTVGALLKNAFPNVPNRIIPFTTWALGVVAYLAISKGWSDPGQWIAAIVAAATATGAHSGVKNTLQSDAPKGGPDDGKLGGTLGVLALVALLGLGCVTEKRLEAGGAYAASATQAAQPELFALDAAFDLAESALDAVFKHEKANREVLWKISPNIKRGLDRIRREATTVKGDYALARTIYLQSPTPAGLNELQTALNKLQVANVAALNVIEKKGNP